VTAPARDRKLHFDVALYLDALAARIAEFAPGAAARCGTSPAAGAARMLAAGARQLHPRTRRAVVSLDGGASVAVDLATAHGRRLFAYGFCEPAARAMRALLRPGDVMIDAGANIGLFTVLAAAHVGSHGRVIACEPSTPTMELLRDNVARNGFDWVELREVALAEQPGRLEMQVFEPGSGFSSFAPAETSGASTIEVDVTTLDEVAGELLERTRLVKLDVEGAELRALRGAGALLERARPDFIVELEPEHLERQGARVADLQALFDDAGYLGYAICETGLEPLRTSWLRPAGDPNIVVRPQECERG
jgi:FkbM family methyltransferase